MKKKFLLTWLTGSTHDGTDKYHSKRFDTLDEVMRYKERYFDFDTIFSVKDCNNVELFNEETEEEYFGIAC